MKEVGHPTVENRESRHGEGEQDDHPSCPGKAPQNRDARHSDRGRKREGKHDQQQRGRRLGHQKARLRGRRQKHVQHVGVQLDARHQRPVARRRQEIVVHAREVVGADQDDFARHLGRIEGAYVDVCQGEVLACVFERPRPDLVIDQRGPRSVDLEWPRPCGAESRRSIHFLQSRAAREIGAQLVGPVSSEAKRIDDAGVARARSVAGGLHEHRHPPNHTVGVGHHIGRGEDHVPIRVLTSRT